MKPDARARSAQDGVRDLSVRIESGPVLELVATVLASLQEKQHAYYDLGDSWFRKIKSDMPHSVGLLRTFAGGSAMVWDHLFALAMEVAPDHQTASLADHLESMDAEALRLELLGRRHRPIQRAVGGERIEQAAAGDPTAQRDFLRLAFPEDSAWQTGARQLLKQSAAETQKAVLKLLRSLDRDLTPLIDPWLPALSADAEEKRKAAAKLDPLALIRSAIDTPYTPTGDVTGVVLTPSFVIRPFVFYIEHADQLLFLYPIAQRFAGSIGAGPPDRLVRLAAALGDRGRLEILAALKERDMSLKELGEALALPRSTLQHHVRILRGAGLLRPMQSGEGFARYQLREEAATDLAELVENFLRPR